MGDHGADRSIRSGRVGVGARLRGGALGALVAGLLMAGLVGCSDDESDRGVVGPAVEVNCAAQTRAGQARNPGIGDTDVRVQCPGAI
jgi:hypothetical protein